MDGETRARRIATLARIRTELAVARANLCSHGVRRTHCNEPHDLPSNEETTDA